MYPSFLSIVIFILFSFPAALFAREDITPSPTPSPSAPPITPTPTPLDKTFIDRWYDSITHFMTEEVSGFDTYFAGDDLEGKIDNFDYFFGNEEWEEEIQLPWIKIKGSVEWKEGGKFVFKQQFRYGLPLPILERRLHLTFGSDADDDLTSDPAYEDTKKDEHFSTGFRYFFKDFLKHIKTSVNTGVSLKGNILKLQFDPVVYVKPRIKWSYSLPPCNYEVTEYLFWYSDDGFGESTRFDFNWLMAKRWLFKTGSEAEWSETSLGVDLGQSFALQYLDYSLRHSDHFATSLEWSSSAHTWTAFEADKHVLALRLRHSIWRSWLRIEVSPRLTWERVKKEEGGSYWREASPSLILALEILFEEQVQKGEN